MNRQARDQVMERLRERHLSSDLHNMRKVFADDPKRFERFSAKLESLLLDWSKCAVDDAVMSLLVELAHAAGLVRKRDALFAGSPVNVTEQRPALHMALRNRSDRPMLAGGKDVMPEVRQVLARMQAFANEIRDGRFLSSQGERFTDIVNIGIGGSDLGPAMATAALRPYHTGPNLHFVSNVDSAHIGDTLRTLDPSTTFFIIASKTFTTVETMTNAATARRWIVETLDETAVERHFAAVSTALDKVRAFGIAENRVFGFWDWVGGRYSIWSAIGLSLMIAIGPENFDHFLDGGYVMDEHFRTAPLLMNLPVILGLMGFWHRNICNYDARAVIPYDQRLSRLPAYLQQLDMESNGKRVSLEGVVVDLPTCPIVWGEPGTNGQHAFFQFLHQGTDIVPIEFLVAANSHEDDLPEHQDLLLANCLAQSEALMIGRTLGEATALLLKSGLSPAEAKKLAPHKVFPGNRPSITIAYPRLDPRTLGMLIALFEHRAFVEGCLWDINSFDQWGVELGKELATSLLPAAQGAPGAEASPATLGLLSQLRQMREMK